nr:MarR family transcriptional regulator [Streptomyces sp. SID14478]
MLASITLLLRRVRLVPIEQGLSMPERSALSLLERAGPASSSELARDAQITAQAMGATIRTLRERGLVDRRADPEDGRRMLLSVNEAGQRALQEKRNARTEQLARALGGGAFTQADLRRLAAAAPLLERLARNL